MIISFDFLVLTFGLISISFIYIYYKLCDSKYVFDFFIFRMISFIYSIFFILHESFNTKTLQNIFTKLYVSFDIIGGILIIFFLYESILRKRFKKKYKYLIPIFTLYLFFIFFDLIFFDINVIYIKYILKFISIFASIEIILILILFINKISSKLKITITKFIALYVLAISCSGITKSIFKISGILNSLLIFNFIFLIYFLIKIIKEIKKLNEKSQSITTLAPSDFIQKMQQYKITKREKEIIQLILSGKSNLEIADELFVSVNTVKNHISNIYRKLDIQKRSDLFNLL